MCINFVNHHCATCTVINDENYEHSSGDNMPCHHCTYVEHKCDNCIHGPYECELLQY